MRLPAPFPGYKWRPFLTLCFLADIVSFLVLCASVRMDDPRLPSSAAVGVLIFTLLFLAFREPPPIRRMGVLPRLHRTSPAK